MRVKVDESYGKRYVNTPTVNLGVYVYNALSGAAHDAGVVENMDATLVNTRTLIANLVSKLVEKGVLDVGDVPTLLGNDDKLTAVD